MVSYKAECERLNRFLKSREKKIKFLTKNYKYKDVKSRIEGLQNEIIILQKRVEKERNKLTPDRVRSVLEFLIKRELLKEKELNKIIKRYNFFCMQKKNEKRLDVDMVGLQKTINKFKEEILQ